MSWTDDRVEVLKKLWMEGLSASQIAGELGQGVTRNAVIGKVHRLKLSARAKPASTSARPRAARPSRRVNTGTRSSSPGVSMAGRRSMGSAPMIGATALKQSEDVAAEMEMAPAHVQEIFIPEAERIGLLGLTEDTCKWPIGDPVSTEFHFCGQGSLDGKPYCEFHSKRAYHQVDRRRR